MNEAVACAYSNHSQVQALGDIKALLLLGIDASLLRSREAAFTPENTGERAYSEYFHNIMIPRLESLGDDCPPEVRATVVQDLKRAAPLRCTFLDLLRDTYRAHPGLHLEAGGSQVMARREFFLLRVGEVLKPSKSELGGKKRRESGGKKGAKRGRAPE